MKILNIEWFNNVGIITIDDGFEIKNIYRFVRWY